MHDPYNFKYRQAPIDPYQSLANAIIARAYDDYINADNVPLSDPKYLRESILRFFRSDRFRIFSSVDPEYIIKRMLEEAPPLQERKNKRRLKNGQKTV